MKTHLLIAVLFASSAWAQLPNPCDRTCMTGLVDRYLAAMVRRDPSGLPLAKGVRYTENTAEIQVGEGLWVGASEAPTTFKIYAVDPASSQVAFYGVMKEWDKPLIIAMRLKVINGKITEIEHVLAVGVNSGYGLTSHPRASISGSDAHPRSVERTNRDSPRHA